MQVFESVNPDIKRTSPSQLPSTKSVSCQVEQVNTAANCLERVGVLTTGVALVCSKQNTDMVISATDFLCHA